MYRKLALSVIIPLTAILLAACGGTAERPKTPLQGAIPAGELDPAVWGQSYPHEYDSYLKNREMSDEGTKYGGSTQRDHLAEHPELKTLFAGYGFSKEYNEDRGHVYTLEDVQKIKRVNEKTTASCMTCKSANVPGLIAEKGLAYYSTPFSEIVKQVDQPITCANCHDPGTMKLKITQPPLRNALARLGKDPDKLSRQELRTLVCAQCHVEYYFQPASNEVTFPWDKGFTPEAVYDYYQQLNFKDWNHPLSGVPALKAQHPEFETFQGSVHQAAGLACADCHMPYQTVGGQKVSSHWWTSPLKTLNESCTTCHRQGEQWLKEQVLAIQDRTFDGLERAEKANVRAIRAIEEAAKDPAAGQEALARARELQRAAQWYWDWVSAENSMGFHNPSLILNTLNRAVDLAGQAVAAALQASPRAAQGLAEVAAPAPQPAAPQAANAVPR